VAAPESVTRLVAPVTLTLPAPGTLKVVLEKYFWPVGAVDSRPIATSRYVSKQ